jgi:hypothetical protein
MMNWSGFVALAPFELAIRTQVITKPAGFVQPKVGTRYTQVLLNIDKDVP